MAAFLTSVPVSAGLLLFGMIIFICGCLKGINTGLSALAGAVIVGLGARDGLASALFSSFLNGAGEYVSRYLIVFLLLGCFCFLVRETRVGESIGMQFIQWLGADRAPWIILLVSFALQIGGVQNSVFICAAISFPLMKAADLPITIGYTASVAVPPLVAFVMPGAIVTPNTIPCDYLGTTTFAAPLLSAAVFLLGVILLVVYFQWSIRRCRRLGLGYQDSGEEREPGAVFQGIELPNFWLSAAALALVTGLSIFFQLQAGMDALLGLSLALAIGCAFVLITNPKVCFRTIGFKRILNQGCTEMLGFVFMAAMVMGFGRVTQVSGCFEALTGFIAGIQVNPYLTIWLFVALLSGLTASSVSSALVWLGMFSQQFLAMGLDPGAMHRIVMSASATFDSLPHSSTVSLNMSCFKLTFREAYPIQFITTVLIPVAVSLGAVGLAILFYPV